ncbi:MAG: HlyD family efflux transporter periplasmic adaptor subunit, partial [Bacteroidota bacterium]
NSKYYQDQQFELQRELSYTREIIAHLQRSADKHKEFREASTKVNDPIFGEKAKVTGDPDFSEVSQEKLANDNMISIIQYKMKASQLTSRLTELEAEHLSKKRQLHIDLDENFKLLQNQVALWQSKYLLVAPLNGTVSLYKFWNDHQFVSAGEEVMTILPDDGTVMGRMVAPAMGAGKVEVGQAVMIKLYNFPHDEYGVIEGQVRSISTLARQKQYVIDVALTNGLHTSYGKDIEFKQEMAGRASVIVKDLRLFERLLKDFINF